MGTYEDSNSNSKSDSNSDKIKKQNLKRYYENKRNLQNN